MNNVVLIGNLTNDPTARTTQSGISQSSFRIAVQRRFRNAQGNYDADFFNVVAWRQTADFCNSYLVKGRKVAVEGTIQNRSYDAQDGSKRWVTEIIADSVEALSSPHTASDGAQYATNAPSANTGAQTAAASDGFTEVNDDQLPF